MWKIRLSSLVLSVCEAHIIGIDIFTGKKMEDLVPSSHTTSVPFVKKEELQCMCAPSPHSLRTSMPTLPLRGCSGPRDAGDAHQASLCLPVRSWFVAQ